MAKSSYNTILNAEVELTVTIRELELMVKVLKHRILTDDAISTWCGESHLYEELAEVHKKTLEQLKADTEFRIEYDTFGKSSNTLIEERTAKKSEEGEAA